MAITELAINSLKQDEATQLAFSKTIWPTLASLLDEGKGLKLRTLGKMSTVNDTDVSSIFQPVCGMEWEAFSDFQSFVTSDKFRVFAASLPSYVSAATSPFGSSPQVYETNVGPRSVFGAALTELFKVRVGVDAKKEESTKVAWGEFVKSIGKVESLSGVSVNLDEKEFLGIIGWESEQSRIQALQGDGMGTLKGKLQDLETFIVNFGAV